MTPEISANQMRKSLEGVLGSNDANDGNDGAQNFEIPP